MDPTEAVRRDMQAVINNTEGKLADKEWTTDQLAQDFEVEGFAAPFVIVRRKADGVRGSLLFRHSPRVYYGFEPK